MTSIFPSLIEAESIAALPQKHFEGRIVVADTLTSLQGAIKLASQYESLGFDTETKPSFKKGKTNKVCMIQLSGPEIAFIFRINKTGFPDELAQLLSQQNITKIGLSLKDDFRELSKVKLIKPESFVDMQSYVEKFGIQEKSLKKLAALILGIRISKSQQTSNWEADCLTTPQLLYAATDAWVCLEMYNKLKEIENQLSKGA